MSPNGNQNVISNIYPNKISDFLIQICSSSAPQFFLSWNNAMVYLRIILDIPLYFILCHLHPIYQKVLPSLPSKWNKNPSKFPSCYNSNSSYQYLSHRLVQWPPNFSKHQYLSPTTILTQQNDCTKTYIILCSFHVLPLQWHPTYHI